jgi:hypothetical protein
MDEERRRARETLKFVKYCRISGSGNWADLGVRNSDCRSGDWLRLPDEWMYIPRDGGIVCELGEVGIGLVLGGDIQLGGNARSGDQIRIHCEVPFAEESKGSSSPT